MEEGTGLGEKLAGAAKECCGWRWPRLPRRTSAPSRNLQKTSSGVSLYAYWRYFALSLRKRHAHDLIKSLSVGVLLCFARAACAHLATYAARQIGAAWRVSRMQSSCWPAHQQRRHRQVWTPRPARGGRREKMALGSISNSRHVHRYEERA